MFPPLSVTFRINDGSWDIIFVGRVMQLSQSIAREADLDPILTHFEQTLPALLSLTTGLSIFAETVEIGLGDTLEARAEVLIPPNSFRVIGAEARVGELRSGIEMLGFALSSAGFILASSYLREAIFFDASYNGHNPYAHSLVVLLKCSQAIEILFGGQRDAIREKCELLGVPGDVIESQIIPITLARHSLGSAHASSFVPNSSEVAILREFAHRSVHTVRQLLLHISRVEPGNAASSWKRRKEPPTRRNFSPCCRRVCKRDFGQLRETSRFAAFSCLTLVLPDPHDSRGAIRLALYRNHMEATMDRKAGREINVTGMAYAACKRTRSRISVWTTRADIGLLRRNGGHSVSRLYGQASWKVIENRV